MRKKWDQQDDLVTKTVASCGLLPGLGAEPHSFLWKDSPVSDYSRALV